MPFNREKFFNAFRMWRGTITQQQVDGINKILSYIENDSKITLRSWSAYMLATIFHETAYTMQPIHEYGGSAYFNKRYGPQTRVGRTLGNTRDGDGARFAGKGFVQLTGRSNFTKMTSILPREYPQLVTEFEARTGKRFDLVADPAQAMDSQIAYAVMSYGMRHGTFTGRKLSQYLTTSASDYNNARRIINGTDKAERIAAYARSFDKILKASFEVPEIPQVDAFNPQVSRPEPISATPDPEPEPAEKQVITPASEPASTSAGIVDTLSGYGDKAGELSDKFGKVSQSSLWTMVTSKVGAWGVLGFGLFEDKLPIIIVGAVIVIAVLLYFNYSKKRATERVVSIGTGNGNSEVQTVTTVKGS